MRSSKKQRAEEIHRMLEALFPNVPVPLQHKDAYTLLVAVLLSAQCTDERVNKVTPNLFVLADTPQSMMMLEVSTIESIIRPCGLSPQKSKAIHGLSKIIVEKFNGEVPDNLEDLETLPGVGHKTASVVVSQAFGQPAFPVDTHIHRLAHRWKLSDGSNVKKTEEDLKKLFPESSWNKLHLQIIYYGRKYCPARGHTKDLCPICLKFGWGIEFLSIFCSFFWFQFEF
jgi:endonuclease III